MRKKSTMLSVFFALISALCASVTAIARQNDGTVEPVSRQRILIAYFSHSGNTRLIANDIHQRVGGDIFEIRTVRRYAPDFDTTVDQAREDLRNDARPELAEKVANMQDYDVVFLGFPNWVGTMPMALFTFLEQHDFTDKTIVPFCTHGTSGIGNTISDLKRLKPQIDIRQHIDIYRNDVRTAEKPIEEWLRRLGYIN
jgi:flavodoxin